MDSDVSDTRLMRARTTSRTKNSETHLTNRSDSYQGTASAVPNGAQEDQGLSPYKNSPSGAEARVFVEPLRHG
jgi:hypothetical protein